MIRLAGLFNSKAAKIIAGRNRMEKDLDRLDPNLKTVWFHCASVGEFEQALPLIRCIQEKYSRHQILVSFFSSSGYEFAQKKYPELIICYLPADLPGDMRSLIQRINPMIAIFIKYEFWFNLLTELKVRNVPTFLVSGIFRSSQVFFKFYGDFFRKGLQAFQHFFVQDEESAALLAGIGLKNVSISGDTRFDQVLFLKSQSFSNDVILDFKGDSKLFIAGSVWNSDIPVLVKIINLLPETFKVVLVPHEPSHFDISLLPGKPDLYSQTPRGDSRILILDTMGMLSKVYRWASLVYVGGGFGKGIHNILEPAVFGVPILIGPNHRKFREALALCKEEVAFAVEPEKIGDSDIQKWVGNEEFLAGLKARSDHYIAANTNVSAQIAVFLNGYLS
ncbi:MAG: hypothetical protein JNJ58_10900 [Chitinophagaceae bacterium]|nr:hypothetical protein [Chitinophagaceae bacterium]